MKTGFSLKWVELFSPRSTSRRNIQLGTFVLKTIFGPLLCETKYWISFVCDRVVTTLSIENCSSYSFRLMHSLGTVMARQPWRLSCSSVQYFCVTVARLTYWANMTTGLWPFAWVAALNFEEFCAVYGKSLPWGLLFFLSSLSGKQNGALFMSWICFVISE